MRRLIKYTAAAAITMAVAPLMAQEAVPPAPMPGEAASETRPNDMAGNAAMSPERIRTYGLWPEERQAMFDSWPEKTKMYFWTLTPPRQEVFWMLSDADRLTLIGMSVADQEQTWTRLEQQMLASQPPAGTAPSEPAPHGADRGDDAMNEVEDHSPR